MLQRDGATVSGTDLDQLLDSAVSTGAVERIYNTSGVVSYKELVNNSSGGIAASSGSSTTVETESKRESKPKPKKSAESSQKESKKADRKTSQQSLQLGGGVSHETLSADCKPTLVVDKHTDLSDVVLQVILRLGCASGKVVEKDIRSHYRLDMYPGVDVRRHIRLACKSLVRREQLRQDGNNFVLKSGDDDDDAADVTLTVDEPTFATTEKSLDTQVEVLAASL